MDHDLTLTLSLSSVRLDKGGPFLLEETIGIVRGGGSYPCYNIESTMPMGE